MRVCASLAAAAAACPTSAVELRSQIVAGRKRRPWFGVPLSNYLGWLLTSWLFFQSFALILRRRNGAAGRAGPSRTLRLIAVLFYLSAGLTYVVPYAMGQRGEAADGAGHLWRIQDIREATVAIFMLTMLLAGLRLWLTPDRE